MEPTLADRQVGPNYFNVHYGKCCHIHYVFSRDTSFVMNFWSASVNTILSAWRIWLVGQFWSGASYYVAVQNFTSTIAPYQSYLPGLIHKYPNFWWPVNGIGYSGSSFFAYSDAISFLIDRFSQPDHICYTLISYRHPHFIWINSAVAASFVNSYKKWLQYGCSLEIRVINVRNLPSKFDDKEEEENQQKISMITLTNMFSQAGILFSYGTPSTTQ